MSWPRRRCQTNGDSPTCNNLQRVPGQASRRVLDQPRGGTAIPTKPGSAVSGCELLLSQALVGASPSGFKSTLPHQIQSSIHQALVATRSSGSSSISRTLCRPFCKGRVRNAGDFSPVFAGLGRAFLCPHAGLSVEVESAQHGRSSHARHRSDGRRRSLSETPPLASRCPRGGPAPDALRRPHFQLTGGRNSCRRPPLFGGNIESSTPTAKG